MVVSEVSVFWWSVGIAWACPDLGAALDQTEKDLIAVRSEAVEAGLAKVEASLGCELASPETIARMWLLDGVHATVIGDRTRAIDAFSAVAEIDQTVWNDIYGEAVREQYESALAVERGVSQIDLEPGLGGNIAYIDGSRNEDVSQQASGLHVIQITSPEGEVQFGKILYLSPEQTLVVKTGVAPAPFPMPSRRVRKSGHLLAASALLVTSGALAFGADRQNRSLRSASDVGSLDRAFAGQASMAGGSVMALAGSTIFAFSFAKAQKKARAEEYRRWETQRSSAKPATHWSVATFHE